MRFGNREGRARGERRGSPARGLSPRVSHLEARELMAVIDLINVATPPGPYGVQLVGPQPSAGTGYSSAQLGDVNGDGFDDFLIGAPTINSSIANFPTLGTGSGSAVYLVFGSQSVFNLQSIDFLSLAPNDRAGDLDVLGNANQTNPLTNQQGFLYNGVTFNLPGFQNAQVGASVSAAGDVNGDGLADFLIGAPGASDPANPLNTRSGQAFLVYGSPNLASRNSKLVDLGNASTFADLSVITFAGSQINGQVGRGVAGIGDFIPDGINDVAIGAPGATVNGIAQSGAVFVVSGTFLRPARTQVINVYTVGQPNGPTGVVFSGENAGQGAGFSVAGAGDVDGVVGGVSAGDLLIGAPATTTGLPNSANGPGRAYLVYGSNTLLTAATGVGGSNTITLNRIGDPAGAADIPGAVFVGTGVNSLAGYSVSSGGDFNNDGRADVLIGSPGALGSAGRADLFFGNPISPSSARSLLGTFALGNPIDGLNSVSFIGASAGDLAGFGIGAVQSFNTDSISEIVIGAPGVNSSSGNAFVIPGNPDLTGSFLLDAVQIQNAPAVGTVISLSQPVAANFLGTSVSGLRFDATGGFTVDGDSQGDFIVGAPGQTPVAGRTSGGSAFELEGGLVPLATPVATSITSPIGVGGTTAPFVINATTPADLRIFILSSGSNTPGFVPATDIDPATIAVNGVPLPDPTTFTNEGDLDGDGLADASFVFSPRSQLNLVAGTTTFTVDARTFANARYQGTAPVQVVTGGGGGGGGGGAASPLANTFLFGFQSPNAAAPRFGERLLPSVNVLGRPRWAPLPVRLAYRQFVPQGVFGLRLRNALHPGTIEAQNDQIGRTRTLSRDVFTRGRFKGGAFFGSIDHKGPVIGGPLTGVYGTNLGRNRSRFANGIS